MRKLYIVMLLVLLPVAVSAQWLKTDILTADDTTTSTSLVASHLSFTVGVGQKWQFHAVLYANADSATGLKLGIDIPTSATVIAATVGNTTSVTAFKEDRITADATAGAALITAAAGSGVIYVDGTVTGTTAGSVTIQLETVTAGKVTLKTGSTLIAQRLQ